MEKEVFLIDLFNLMEKYGINHLYIKSATNNLSSKEIGEVIKETPYIKSEGGFKDGKAVGEITDHGVPPNTTLEFEV